VPPVQRAGTGTLYKQPDRIAKDGKCYDVKARLVSPMIEWSDLPILGMVAAIANFSTNVSRMVITRREIVFPVVG
jgi:hypothetical protein